MMRAARGTLRLRFTVRSAVAAFVLVAAIGGVLSIVWSARLDAAREAGLTGHVDAIVAEAQLAGASNDESRTPLVLPSPETHAQVIAADGRIVAASRMLQSAIPLISPRELGDAETVERIVDSAALGETVLAMGKRFSLSGEQYIAIAATPLDQGLGRYLPYLAVPVVALLVAGLVAAGVWVSVGNALLPVAAMADEADEIAAGRRPWQLRVPARGGELVHLADRLDGLLSKIRETFEREREFLDDASHELRTPIAIARGELELARAGTDDAPVRDALTSAMEEIDRLDRLTEDLLVLARVGGSTGSGRLRQVELAEMCARAVSAVGRVTPDSGIAVTLGGSASAVVDPDALERAIGNVVANAVRYAKSRVDVAINAGDGRAVIEVTDDGPGFPAGRIDEMFSRFVRQPRRGDKGTGLGLAIAAAIVAAHAGSIEASNPPGGGARVVIAIPLVAGPSQRSPGPGAELVKDH